MSAKSLEELLPGETAVIQGVNGEEDTHLLEMGLTAGTPVKLIKFAPFGDPLELKVRGYHLSIRRSEAKEIVVQTMQN
ncbi:MAG: ferrous iron transport protein A [bacterium]